MIPIRTRPKKSLGQHFLTDEAHLAKIIAAADLTPSDTVLEIGPGLGTLTRLLAAQAGQLIAVELDDRLISPLRTQFADQPSVTIVHGDILETEPGDLLKSANAQNTLFQPYKVVANLPYYITSAVLRHMLEAAHKPTLMVVMVQKEVAERICAEPGDFSLLAVSVQFYANAQIVHHVPAKAFRPPPKVDSAVLRLDLLPAPAVAGADVETFFDIVRAGFGQKRKQLLNSLSAGMKLSKAEVEAWLGQAGIEPTRRAETLSLVEWGRVYQGFQGDDRAAVENYSIPTP